MRNARAEPWGDSMRLIYFGIDDFADVLTRILEDGHEVETIFTCRTDNKWNFNRQIVAAGRRLGVPVHFGRPRPELLSRSSGVLVSACYPHRIPVLPSIRGVNLHPTLLPAGRGPWPLPHVIRSQRQHAGLTLHKLTQTFDRGDILAQTPIALADDDDLDTLSAKLRLAAPDFVSTALRDFDRAWDEATPQDGGSYWRAPTMEARMLHGSQTVAENLNIVRAFGRFEARVEIEARRYCVSSASGWREPHNRELGVIVSRYGRDAVMAVRDGYLVLRNPRLDHTAPTPRQIAGAVRHQMRQLFQLTRSLPRL